LKFACDGSAIKKRNVLAFPHPTVSTAMFMLSKRWARAFYISTYVAIIVGIGIALLVTGYDLIEQTLELAQGGGRYFYIFILVGAYVATVLSHSSTQTNNRVVYQGLLH